MPVVKFIVVAIVIGLRLVAVVLCVFVIGLGVVAHMLAAMVNYPGEQ